MGSSSVTGPHAQGAGVLGMGTCRAAHGREGALPVTSPPAGVQTPDCAFTAVLKCRAGRWARLGPALPMEQRENPTGRDRSSQPAAAPQSTQEGREGPCRTLHSPAAKVGSWGPAHELRDASGSAQPCTRGVTEPQRGEGWGSCYPPAKAACDGIR